MFDYTLLRTLEAVIRCGSFEAASVEIGVTASAISQRIRALEELVGTTLVLRTQPCRATHAGARLARHVEDVQLMEHQLSRDLGGDLVTDWPRIRIAADADTLIAIILPALAAVPDSLYDLINEDSAYADELLRRAEVQIAITSVAEAAPGCDCAALGALRYLAVASPAFVKRWFPDGATADALAAAPAATYNPRDHLQINWAQAQAGRPVQIPTHYIASEHGIGDACRLSLAWGMNAEPLIAKDLAAGSLVELNPRRPLDHPLYLQSVRLMRKPLSPVIRAIRKRAAEVLYPRA